MGRWWGLIDSFYLKKEKHNFSLRSCAGSRRLKGGAATSKPCEGVTVLIEGGESDRDSERDVCQAQEMFSHILSDDCAPELNLFFPSFFVSVLIKFC